jgi:phosphatidylserine/phosphatidylglycerophosphate/cardiolipin synthase-like enzyme
MANDQKRPETVYLNSTGVTKSSVQWLLDKQRDTHLISTNNALKVFICGQDGFADIAGQIAAAEESIDICCWGFDPGMELVRGGSQTWPRGPTYGDLLIAAGKRGVAVRLLVWYDAAAASFGPANPRNMPGYTHDTQCKRDSICTLAASEALHAQHSIVVAANEPLYGNFRRELMPIVARQDYCYGWFLAAFAGRLKGVRIRRRAADSTAVKASIKSEASQPEEWSAEELIMKYFGSHHQKPILIDYYHDNGAKAVGYVMGLNSITDYWDSASHQLDDPRREQELIHSYRPDTPFKNLKPYRDYACRIDRGGALIALHENFNAAWERAVTKSSPANATDLLCRPIPAAMLKEGPPDGPSVQIVRTQPEEKDKTIKDLYFMATDQATQAIGYLYVENQYFQWEEWAQRLLTVRKQVIAKWKAGCAKAGLTMEDMPIMHVFIVIPLPERAEMVPRTYDTLATLGKQDHMSGQRKMIDMVNQNPSHTYMPTSMGPPVDLGISLPDVVIHANQIAKPSAKKLETQYGVKVCTAMLSACGSDGSTYSYREIYIHSKLMLIDDTFFTLGSANLNQRSMAVDSEINVATVDPVCATDLRKRVWSQLTGNKITGGNGTRAEIATSFYDWMKLMNSNELCKRGPIKMTGFLLPLDDDRSSTLRLG